MVALSEAGTRQRATTPAGKRWQPSGGRARRRRVGKIRGRQNQGQPRRLRIETERTPLWIGANEAGRRAWKTGWRAAGGREGSERAGGRAFSSTSRPQFILSASTTAV